MSLTKFWAGCCALALGLSATGAARGTVFFTDTFSYENGPLVTDPPGDWTTHSGTTGQMQVVDGQASVKINEGEDVNRSTGQVIPEGGSWYFATKIRVIDQRADPLTQTINTNYFMHFKDEGTFSFRTRTYIKAPNAASPTTFSFGMSAGSLTAGDLGNGALVPWTAGDFEFGSDIVLVGKYTSADGLPETPDEGFGQLWVNPTTAASPSIIDSMPNPNNLLDDAMSRLALRQAASANQPQVLVDVLAVGDTFNEVLAAVSAGPGGDDADFDGDGDIDGADYLTWQKNLGTTSGATLATGDANGNGAVNGDDLTVWKSQFATAVGAVGAVPEPGSVVLALGMIAGLGACRRRA